MSEAVVANGVRWASNILVELLGNYGGRIAPEAREHIKVACSALQQAQAALAGRLEGEAALPTKLEKGFCTLGIDYGATDDPCAWVVVWSARGCKAGR